MSEEVKRWEMPDWMNKYMSLITFSQDDKGYIEDAMNCNPQNFIQCGIRAQVNLLIKMYNQGLIQ